MATTWQQADAKLSGNDLTFEIQEVVNGTPGNKYSVTLNKGATEQQFKDKLKIKINADRTKTVSETTLKTKVDLSTFETFLGS